MFNFLKKCIAYLRDNPEGYWFKRKLFGWGWTPATWQGFLVIAVYLFLIIFDFHRIDSLSHSESDTLIQFLPHVFILTLVLLLICYEKGETPRWQWGLPSSDTNDSKCNDTHTHLSLGALVTLFVLLFAIPLVSEITKRHNTQSGIGPVTMYLSSSTPPTQDTANTSTTPAPIRVTGDILCLPLKDTTGPQTMECAYGIKSNTGEYYALDDHTTGYENVMGIPMNSQITVSGIFSPRTDSEYKDIGVISVTHIERVEPIKIQMTPGTIQGTVFLGPTCSVVRNPPDPACADKPYQTELAVTSPGAEHIITQFSTASDGTFAADLPEGTYAIQSADGARVFPRCATNEPFVVHSGQYTDVVVYCDTGIR